MPSRLDGDPPPSEPSSTLVATKERSWIERLAPFLVVGFIAQMAVAMLLTASKDAPVFDETTHIVAGVMNVREHDLRWNAEHPPLMKVLAGLATLRESINIPKQIPAYRDGHEFDMGRAVLYEAGNDPNRIVWRARLPMIALTLAFALVVFGFARDLFGVAGAVVAVALYSLCPTILAHGRLVHTDVALGGFVLTTSWFVWRSEQRGLIWTALAGAAFGLALSSKFSALFTIPAVALVAFWSGFRGRGPRFGRRLLSGVGRAALLFGIAFGVLWMVYLATSPDLRFETRFYDVWAERTGGVSAEIIDRLPVPEAYRVGLRFATAFDQAGTRRAFLLGDDYTGGRAVFYPAVLLMKTPLGSLAMWAGGLAIITLVRRRADALRALLPIPLVFLGFAVISSTNIGIRHIALIPMFAAVIAGSVAVARHGIVVAFVLIALVAGSVWSRAYSSPLPYVNEAFGRPSDVHEILADSNSDWGQDLRRLADYVRAHPETEPSWILYFGTAVPAAYGIQAGDITKSRRSDVHGLVAVSTSWLDLFPDRYGWIEDAGLRVAQATDTILIYRVP